MQVILMEPGKLGKTGDIVEVKNGYARNWLIPQGIATSATAANMKSLEARIRARQKIQAQEKATAEDLASRLNGVAVEMSVRAGEGKIYGAVTTPTWRVPWTSWALTSTSASWRCPGSSRKLASTTSPTVPTPK